jgi:hypothetical protein
MLAPSTEQPPPEKAILDGLGSIMSVFRTPVAQVAIAKKFGFSSDDMAVMNDLSKHQANGGAMPFSPPPAGPVPGAPGGAPPSPPWPPELEPVLAQLTPEERAETIQHLSHPQMTTAHVEQICAELRACPSLAEKVGRTRVFLSLARQMR